MVKIGGSKKRNLGQKNVNFTKMEEIYKFSGNRGTFIYFLEIGENAISIIGLGLRGWTLDLGPHHSFTDGKILINLILCRGCST